MEIELVEEASDAKVEGGWSRDDASRSSTLADVDPEARSRAGASQKDARRTDSSR